MTNYFYLNANGHKQGPISENQLEELASKGIIRPDTQVELDGGYTFSAEQILKTFSATPTEDDLEEYEEKKESSVIFDIGFFDIGFTRFISNSWISIIWVIVIVVHILAMIGAAVSFAGEESPVPFLIALFVAPISLLLCRMILELEVIFFRIETNTRESKEHLREIKELLAQK